MNLAGILKDESLCEDDQCREVVRECVEKGEGKYCRTSPTFGCNDQLWDDDVGKDKAKACFEKYGLQS